MTPIFFDISGWNSLTKFLPSLLMNLQTVKIVMNTRRKESHLRTVLVRIELQDLRYFLGQHAPFLGKRHSSSRLISFSSMDRWRSVTSIFLPFGPSLNCAVTSTESAENLHQSTSQQNRIQPISKPFISCRSSKIQVRRNGSKHFVHSYGIYFRQ